MKILICGDYIAHNDMPVNDKRIFGDFIDIIESSDVAIYNQEHPVTTSKEVYSTKKFDTTDYCNPKLLKPIIEANFTHVTLATNHIFNRGISGLNDTINFFDTYNINSFGAGRNIEEAKKICYYSKEESNSVAFLNFSENEYNTATEKHGGANPLDIIENARQIKEAKSKSDFVFVIIHGGVEYSFYPTKRMVKQFRFYVEQGASAIICHHSHIISTYEVYKGAPIFYGIGNFIPAKFVRKFLSIKQSKYCSPIQFEINDNRLNFKIFPLKFNHEDFKLEYLNDTELSDFEKIQREVGQLLHFPDMLDDKIFENYFDTERASHFYTLFTRSNYFLFLVFRKIGMINLYYKYIMRKMKFNKKNARVWNLYRCEAHRDLMQIVYNKQIDLYEND